MKEKSLKKNSIGLFLLLAVFFFARTAMLAPVQCLLMNPDYPYLRLSAEGFAFIALLIVFSALSAKLAFVFRDKAGDAAALIYVVAVSDPLFFATQDSVLKLFVDIVILLLVFNGLSEKKIVPMGVAFPAALFITTFLVPFSVLGYVPVMISMCILVSRKSEKASRYISLILAGMACAAAGFAINRILVSEVPTISELFSTFGFAEAGVANKHYKMVLSLIPAAVSAFIFFRQYKKTARAFVKKKSERNQQSETVMDAFFLPTLISVVSIFFTGAEGFCAINLIVPAIILTLICLKDEACLRTVNNISDYVKEHKIISIVIFVAVFALAFSGVINYHSTKQLIFYIRY